jgi:hypothetical protein
VSTEKATNFMIFTMITANIGSPLPAEKTFQKRLAQINATLVIPAATLNYLHPSNHSQSPEITQHLFNPNLSVSSVAKVPVAGGHWWVRTMICGC